jgi:hypothetical protein
MTSAIRADWQSGSVLPPNRGVQVQALARASRKDSERREWGGHGLEGPYSGGRFAWTMSPPRGLGNAAELDSASLSCLRPRPTFKLNQQMGVIDRWMRLCAPGERQNRGGFRRPGQPREGPKPDGVVTHHKLISPRDGPPGAGREMSTCAGSRGRVGSDKCNRGEGIDGVSPGTRRGNSPEEQSGASARPGHSCKTLSYAPPRRMLAPAAIALRHDVMEGS